MQSSKNTTYKAYDPENINNPNSLIYYVKPSRIIITDGPPQPTDGEILWYAIDEINGILYFKNLKAVWVSLYVFPSGGGGGAVTDGDNVGTGQPVFKDKNGTILEFKTLRGWSGSLGQGFIPVTILSNGDNVEFRIPYAINSIENFSGDFDASIIKTVTYPNANGYMSIRVNSFKAGDGIDIVDDGIGHIVISSTAQSTKKWAAVYNTNPTNVITFGQGANQVYSVPGPTTNICPAGGFVFPYLTNVSYFGISSGLNSTYCKISYSASLESSPALTSEQPITFILQKAYDLTTVQHSGHNMIIYAGAPLTNFKNGTVSHSFTMLMEPGAYYGLAMIPRAVQPSGPGSLINLVQMSIVITEL